MSTASRARKRTKDETDSTSSAALTPFEEALVAKYAMLEQKKAPARVAASDELSKRKEMLVALAREQEEAERLKFARDQERKRLRDRPAVAAMTEQLRSATAPAYVAGVAGAAAEAPIKGNVITNQVREFDPDEPGHPFQGCEFVPITRVLQNLMDPATRAVQEVVPEGAPFELLKNPHLLQNEVGFYRVPMSRLPATLQPDMPRKKYVWLARAKRSTMHHGLRKLLLQEMDFLRTHGEPGMLVVYAGASPGLHIPKLADLFPDLRFLLVDSAPNRAPPCDRVKIWHSHEAPFSEENMMQASKEPGRKLFISDIRMAPPAGAGERVEGDQYVLEDMKTQMLWHIGINPVASLLKFRLPWEDGTTQYLAGQVYFSSFGPQTTTETRLVVLKGAEKRAYDHRVYEEQMFFFNRMTRVQYYEHQLESYLEGKNSELDHCFDCAREIQILQDYLVANDKWYAAGERDAATGRLLGPIPPHDLATKVVELSEEIKSALEAVTQAAKRMAEVPAGSAPRRDPDSAPADAVGNMSPNRRADERPDEDREEEIDYGDVMNVMN